MAVDALIGDSGFVGTNLARQHGFAARFNSRTIDQAAGGSFDTVLCAAAPGSMFEANRFPDVDRARIDGLIASLDTIEARRFVLISTIATLADFAAADEGTDRFETRISYGVNRRRLEEYVETRFPEHLVVRLPALFGPGLRKNFLFDIRNPMPSMLAADRREELRARLGERITPFYAWNDKLALYVLDRSAFDASGGRATLDAAVKEIGMAAVGFTNPRSRFQFYDMARLWSDIGIGLEADLRTLHLAPAPVVTADLFRALTGSDMPDNEARLHAEDMRTRHAACWRRAGPYLAEPAEVIAAVSVFMRAECAAA